ncbi:MAG TPA: response regulator [Candidatus Acidoferrum sp.]|nr:response regulator [Candidatus Acidoferrum sp.]
MDDEPSVLELYELLFKRQQWEMDFAADGFQALKLMAASSYDAVVSDMRMPQLNGAQLLHEVARLHPRTARFIISGYSDREMVMECLPGTHQFLSKPFVIDDIRTKVLRSMEANEWLVTDAMRDIVAKLFTLPSLPTSYFQLLRAIESPDATGEEVGAIISRDPAMTAKLLQLVNSAFFGLPRAISNPIEAVLHLGMATVRSLALGLHIVTEFNQYQTVQFPVQTLMDHCVRTANAARRIAQHEGAESSLVDGAFTAGLLMDIGTLVMVQNLAPEFEKAHELSRCEKKPLWQAERDVLGVSHAEIGGYLLALWGLPVPIVEAVLHHHEPHRCTSREFSPLVCVHVSNALEHLPREDDAPFTVPEVNAEWIDELGMTDRLQDWRQLLNDSRTE